MRSCVNQYQKLSFGWIYAWREARGPVSSGNDSQLRSLDDATLLNGVVDTTFLSQATCLTKQGRPPMALDQSNLDVERTDLSNTEAPTPEEKHFTYLSDFRQAFGVFERQIYGQVSPPLGLGSRIVGAKTKPQ
ncbi:hypothetical protein PM082_004967 [Marasmius tenuissimus]|nr:hypothetical protein PM082_004967 [Marasmius tenuissimus]